MRPVGARTRALCARLFGEAPVQRFLDPLIADLQFDWAIEQDPRARTRLRLRALKDTLTILPSLAARTEASSMLGWIGAAAFGLALGVAALARCSPAHAPLQLMWIAVASVVVLLLVIGSSAKGLPQQLRVRGAWLLGGLCFVPPVVAGSQWLELGVPLSWAELTRPALLLALVLVSQGAVGDAESSSKQLSPADVHRLALAGATWLSCVIVGDLTTIIVTVPALVVVVGMRAWKLAAVGATLALVSLLAAASRMPSIRVSDAVGHTDAILLNITQTWGLTAAALAVVASVALVWAPLSGTRTRPARALAAAFAATHLTQVALHVGAALALWPALGASLPGISYGGSALFGTIVSLALIAALDASVASGGREKHAI